MIDKWIEDYHKMFDEFKDMEDYEFYSITNHPSKADKDLLKSTTKEKKNFGRVFVKILQMIVKSSINIMKSVDLDNWK